jgi:peptidoglycan LD-endopeptidase CwlK
MDAFSAARLAQVCPRLANKISDMERIIDTEFIFRVTQGLRSWAMQQELWQQGRDIEGTIINTRQIVTDAPPGHSWHEFGLAVDLVPMVNGEPDWDLTHPSWPRLIQVGKSVGLFAGADFSTPDHPHFQLTGLFPESPTDEVRQIFREAGAIGVWQEAGLA